jgi:transcriptional regulator with XRE-family HTH domain
VVKKVEVKYQRPEWAIAVLTELLRRNMSQRRLAKELHINVAQIASVLSGGRFDDRVKHELCAYLGIEE